MPVFKYSVGGNIPEDICSVVVSRILLLASTSFFVVAAAAYMGVVSSIEFCRFSFGMAKF